MKANKNQIKLNLNNFHFLMPGGFLRLLFQKYSFLSAKIPQRIRQFKDIDEIISKFNFSTKDYKKNFSVAYNTEKVRSAHSMIFPIYIEMRRRGWSEKELKK